MLIEGNYFEEMAEVVSAQVDEVGKKGVPVWMLEQNSEGLQCAFYNDSSATREMLFDWVARIRDFLVGRFLKGRLWPEDKTTLCVDDAMLEVAQKVFGVDLMKAISKDGPFFTPAEKSSLGSNWYAIDAAYVEQVLDFSTLVRLCVPEMAPEDTLDCFTFDEKGYELSPFFNEVEGREVMVMGQYIPGVSSTLYFCFI